MKKVMKALRGIYRFLTPLFLMVTGILMFGIGFGVMPSLATNLKESGIGNTVGGIALVGVLLVFCIWGV